jgi:hypothetical protein
MEGTDLKMNERMREGGDYDAVMRQCRAIDKHAAALRGELLWLAGGEGGRARVDRALRAVHEQLRRAEALARRFEDAGRRDAA